MQVTLQESVVNESTDFRAGIGDSRQRPHIYRVAVLTQWSFHVLRVGEPRHFGSSYPQYLRLDSKEPHDDHVTDVVVETVRADQAEEQNDRVKNLG